MICKLDSSNFCMQQKTLHVLVLLLSHFHIRMTTSQLCIIHYFTLFWRKLFLFSAKNVINFSTNVPIFCWLYLTKTVTNINITPTTNPEKYTTCIKHFNGYIPAQNIPGTILHKITVRTLLFFFNDSTASDIWQKLNHKINK